MRDLATSLALLGGALIALAFLDEDGEIKDNLPSCPDFIPEWMLPS